MKLKKLQLENYRNYEQYAYEFDESSDITILVGPNGKGKTNFLEAIYVLSLGRSFRSLHPDDLIEWEKPHMRCIADISHDQEESKLEVFYSKTPRRHKNFRKNGVNLKNSEFIGNLLTVLFHPEDLNILYLSPSLRRKYMNTILSQTDKKYLYALSKYNKVLKQRNALLHELRNCYFKNIDSSTLKMDLESWDFQFIEYGSQITSKRIELVKFLKENLEGIYRKISDSDETIEISYKGKLNLDQELKLRHERDIRQAQSTLGPHRDDLIFHINGKEITSQASRGEFRSLLLAIKLAEIEYIKQKTGRRPILLLDDVFSELDPQRQKHLLNAIKDCQTIITTTDLANLEELRHKSTLINLC